MQIGEKNFLPGKEETRRNPDGFQEFLTQPDEKFSVKIRAGAYWYSFLYFRALSSEIIHLMQNMANITSDLSVRKE